MRILVTGGAGFIGSHLAEAFLERGHRVAILDDLSQGRLENVAADADFFEADITDLAGVLAVYDRFRPDVLCHHAAETDIRRSVRDPLMNAAVNIQGTLNLLEIGVRFATKRVLFASTGGGGIYGEQEQFPANESHPVRPACPYGITKLTCEAYLRYYAAQHGVAWTSLRYANVYGPRQNPDGEAGVVAIFTDTLLRGESPTIHGDGEQTRDFVYVGDVVRANCLALDRDLFGVYNVGTGLETSINTIYERLRDTLNVNIPAQRAAQRPGEQRRSCVDSNKLRNAAGWTPSTSLAEGLRQTAQFFSMRYNQPA